MHIYRIDYQASRTHSWLVTVQRRGRFYHRLFTDRVYGGKRKAIDAAKVYRDRLILSLASLTRPEVYRVRKKNNRSGVSEVTRIDTLEKNCGKTRRRRYWLVQWPTGNGKVRIVKFSITRYGERRARQRALLARRHALRSLPKTV